MNGVFPGSGGAVSSNVAYVDVAGNNTTAALGNPAATYADPFAAAAAIYAKQLLLFGTATSFSVSSGTITAYGNNTGMVTGDYVWMQGSSNISGDLYPKYVFNVTAGTAGTFSFHTNINTARTGILTYFDITQSTPYAILVGAGVFDVTISTGILGIVGELNLPPNTSLVGVSADATVLFWGDASSTNWGVYPSLINCGGINNISRLSIIGPSSTNAGGSTTCYPIGGFSALSDWLGDQITIDNIICNNYSDFIIYNNTIHYSPVTITVRDSTVNSNIDICMMESGTTDAIYKTTFENCDLTVVNSTGGNTRILGTITNGTIVAANCLLSTSGAPSGAAYVALADTTGCRVEMHGCRISSSASGATLYDAYASGATATVAWDASTNVGGGKTHTVSGGTLSGLVAQIPGPSGTTVTPGAAATSAFITAAASDDFRGEFTLTPTALSTGVMMTLGFGSAKQNCECVLVPKNQAAINALLVGIYVNDIGTQGTSVTGITLNAPVALAASAAIFGYVLG